MKLRKSIISDVAGCLEVVADVFKAERIKTKLIATEVLLKKLASQIGVKEFELVLFLEEHGKDNYYIYKENVFEVASQEDANDFAAKVITAIKGKGSPSYHEQEQYITNITKKLNISKAYLLYVIFDVSDSSVVLKHDVYADVLKYIGKD